MDTPREVRFEGSEVKSSRENEEETLGESITRLSLDGTLLLPTLDLPSIKWTWIDREGRNRFSILIILPSGNNPEDIDVKVKQRGTILSVSLLYGNVIMNTCLLQTLSEDEIRADHMMSTTFATEVRRMEKEADHKGYRGLMRVKYPFGVEECPADVSLHMSGIEFLYKSRNYPKYEDQYYYLLIVNLRSVEIPYKEKCIEPRVID